MSTQDPPFSNDDNKTTPNMADMNTSEAGQVVKSDFDTATETAKSDFETVKSEAQSQLGAIKSEAQTQFGALKTEAQTQFDSLKGQAADQFDAVKQEAVGQVDALKGEAKSQISKVADQARGFASDQKDYAADQLGGVAAAMSRVADELDNDEHRAVSGYARTISDSVQRVSETMKNTSLDDLVGTVQDYGRREPVAFWGLAALAGFAVSRFVLASSHRRDKSAPTSGSSYASGDFGTRETGDYRSNTAATGYGSGSSAINDTDRGSAYRAPFYGSTGGNE